MKTPKNVYKRFIEFEERAAGLYLQLASRFVDDARLSSFWLDMALEEKRHAGLLQFCLREELFAVSLPNIAEMQRLGILFKRLEKQAQTRDLSPKDAFTLAIELEYSEMNAIYCHLTTPVHSSTYLLKRKIATFMPNHLSALVAAARKFVGDGAIKELERLKKRCSAQWRGSRDDERRRAG